MQVTKNFSRAELACTHCGEMHVPLASVQRLQRVRDRMGTPLKVSSGYRCPAHNVTVSTTGPGGPHTKAAFDIAISGPAAFLLLVHALAEGFTGIGVNQKGPHESRFIHLDDLADEEGRPRPTIWSY